MKFIPVLFSLVLAQNEKDIPRTFGLYEKRKPQFVFVHYTSNQKMQVAQTVFNLMHVYVNTESKVKHYGPGVNPLQKAHDMIQRAAFLQDREFHYQMLDIFNPLRDLHTVYIMPGPHGCLNNLKAISFSIADKEPNEKIVVHKFTQYKEVLSLSGDLSGISLGDELLMVDEEPIKLYIQNRLATSVGSNFFAAKRRVLERMSIVPGAGAVPPTKHYTKFVLRSVKNLMLYTVTLPWVTVSKDECYNPAAEVYKKFSTGTLMEQLPTFEDPPTNPQIPIKSPAPDFRTMLRQAAFVNIPSNKFIRVTDEIEYMIYTHKNLGVIALKSFYPEDHKLFLKRLFDVIVFQMATVKAILFDVRGNSSGLIFLAEAIPQLFKEKIQPTWARALNSPLNRDLMTSPRYPYEEWTQAMKNTPVGSPFTQLVQFTPTAAANVFKSRIWKKPVAILNDATCYSACDVFCALFQDNHVGHVYGEDATSGAGGAIVVNMHGFFTPLDPVRFPALPYSRHLTKLARPDITIAYEQIVRVGQYSYGKTIEDLGVVPTQMFRPTQADFLEGTTTYSVYDRIADHLEEQSSHIRKPNKFFFW